METSAPLINAIINNPLLHSNSNSQIDAASNHSHPALFVVDSLPQILQWNVLRPGLFSSQKPGSSVGLLHYWIFRLEEQMISASTQLAEKITISRIYYV